MRPDYHSAFASANRASHYEGARTKQRVDGLAQLHLRHKARSEFDQARRAATYCGDITLNEVISQLLDKEEEQMSLVRENTPPPSSSSCRPEELPRTFDIKFEHDLAAIINAIQDAHFRLNTPQDLQSASRQNGPETLTRSEARTAPVEEPLAKDDHLEIADTCVPQPSEVEPRPHNHNRIWFGALMMIGAFLAGIYARDNIAPIAQRVWNDIQLLARSSSALVAFNSSKAHESQPVLFRNISRASAPTERGISPAVFPDSYGLYAMSAGQLTRLDPLRVRVPDTRIALPGLITKPSAVSVSDGHLTFLAYQRDLMTNVPDKATIRVVAQVAHNLTFPTSGKPKVTPIEDTWAIRAVSVDLTVAPVPDSPEMVVIRPSDPDLSLSPGRYMLVFKGQAYDFSVEGTVTDTAHCLERTETQTGGVFTECRELPDLVSRASPPAAAPL